jgi:hypothetical protein
MADRAHKVLQCPVIRPYTVAASQTVTVGKTAKFASADNEVQDAGAASDLAIGVVLPNALANSSGVVAAGVVVEVIHPFPIVPMKVGTGGATRGKKQKVVSDGVTDGAANGGGTTASELIGIAMQTGVVGDEIGVGLIISSRVTV